MKHLHPRCPVIVTVFAIQNELQCMGMAMDMIMYDPCYVDVYACIIWSQ